MGKLTALDVKRETKPGRYGDGGGLWLQVRKAERRGRQTKDGTPAEPETVINKSWLLRYMLNGTARQMGLGPVELVSLAEARDAAIAARKLLLHDIDPLEERAAARAAKAAKAGALTFRQTAERYIAAHKAAWKNEKHQAQWPATLAAYAYPLFGDHLVAEVDTGDVMKALEPIWSAKPETANRLRGRIEAILDYAKSRGWRTGENPARWKGHVANLLPKRTKVRAVQHHAALPWGEIGGFMAELREESGTAALALQFAILTAARTGEVIGATWSEIDLQAKVWTIPGERMKAGREHRVPLSAAALAVLTEAGKQWDGSAPDAFVFPGRKNGKGLSNMAFLMMLRRMDKGDLTAHGFRSTFRDWAGETGQPADLAEAALAHVVGDKTVAAYARGDLLERRRKLMEAWAAFCGRSPGARGEVVALRAASA